MKIIWYIRQNTPVFIRFQMYDEILRWFCLILLCFGCYDENIKLQVELLWQEFRGKENITLVGRMKCKIKCWTSILKWMKKETNRVNEKESCTLCLLVYKYRCNSRVHHTWKKVDDDEREHERRRQQLLKFVHNTHYYVWLLLLVLMLLLLQSGLPCVCVRAPACVCVCMGKHTIRMKYTIAARQQ